MEFNRNYCAPEDSVLNNQIQACPKVHAKYLVMEAFPNGILGYEMASMAAERAGTKATFDKLVADLVAKVESELAAVPSRYARTVKIELLEKQS